MLVIALHVKTHNKTHYYIQIGIELTLLEIEGPLWIMSYETICKIYIVRSQDIE